MINIIIILICALLMVLLWASRPNSDYLWHLFFFAYSQSIPSLWKEVTVLVIKLFMFLYLYNINM